MHKEYSIKRHLANYTARKSLLIKDLTGLTTIDHEYAHQIDDLYTLMRDIRLKTFFDEYKIPINMKHIGPAEISFINEKNKALFFSNSNLGSVVWDRLQLDFNLDSTEMYVRVEQELGKYALKNKKEFLAEGFANFRNLREEDKTKFVQTFEKIFNEEFDNILRGRV